MNSLPARRKPRLPLKEGNIIHTFSKTALHPRPPPSAQHNSNHHQVCGKTRNCGPYQEKKQSADSDMTQMLELADDGFKTVIVNTRKERKDFNGQITGGEFQQRNGNSN